MTKKKILDRSEYPTYVPFVTGVKIFALAGLTFLSANKLKGNQSPIRLWVLPPAYFSLALAC